MAQTMDLITQLQVCAFNRFVSESQIHTPLQEQPEFHYLLLHYILVFFMHLSEKSAMRKFLSPLGSYFKDLYYQRQSNYKMQVLNFDLIY